MKNLMMQRAVKRRPSTLCSALHFITSQAKNKTDENECVDESVAMKK